MSRFESPALNEILGKQFPVLDKGFVRVVDYMGNDEAIVQAARISYGKGTKSLSEDESLIRYLLRHSHTTPFEMCELKLHIRIPMDAWRQFIRHRTANVNEYSTRYSEAIDDKQRTLPDAWRLQSKTNKQGSAKDNVSEFPVGFQPSVPHSGIKDAGEYLSNREADFHAEAEILYQERLLLGVAKEVARKDLPLSTYTEAYWKCDLHNILHFLSLRMDKHAQKEIRDYANVMGEIVELWCPLAWKAFNDYNFRRQAILLTARDASIIRRLPNMAEDALDRAVEFGWFELSNKTNKIKENRERSECEAKLEALGFGIPWQIMPIGFNNCTYETVIVKGV